MNSSVHIVGAGTSRFGSFEDTSAADLAVEASGAALLDAGLPIDAVETVVVGSSMQGPAFGQRVAVAGLGLRGLPILNVENVCASSASAFHVGAMAIEAGSADIVLVIGAEKLSGRAGGALSVDPGGYYDRIGMILPALYSLRASRYLAQYGGDPDDFAEIAVKNRAAGAVADHAYQRQPVTREAVLASRQIADYLTLFQICRNADGAAALLLASEAGLARTDATRAVEVLSHQLRSGEPFGRTRDVLSDEVTPAAAQAAFEVTGLGPEDIDVAQVHDATTIGEVLNCEALGLLPHGEGLQAVAAGETTAGGRVAVNTDGGLIARGHPIGATGAAQLVELVTQLRGEAGDRQTREPRYGLAHATGGGVFGIETAAACNVTLLGAPGVAHPTRVGR